MRKTLCGILTAGLFTLASAPALAVPVMRINIGIPKIVVAKTHPAIAYVPPHRTIKHKVYVPHPYQPQAAPQYSLQDRAFKSQHPVHPEHPEHPEHPLQSSLENREHPQSQGWTHSFSRRDRFNRR